MKTQTKEKSYTDDVAQGRMAIMKSIQDIQSLPDPQSDENYREPLCVDTRIVKNIMLSTGGPADGFKLYFDIDEKSKELELSHAVYWRADWGSYKESDLTMDDAQTVYDFYLGGYAEI